MGESQLAQIDCRIEKCIFYGGSGKCGNISPAITLNPSNTFVCWSFEDEKTIKEDEA